MTMTAEQRLQRHTYTIPEAARLLGIADKQTA